MREQTAIRFLPVDAERVRDEVLRRTGPVVTVDAPRTLRRLTDFLGMPPLPDEATQSAPVSVIATASVWQARQPVYTSSIGRWKQYAPFVPELERLF